MPSASRFVIRTDHRIPVRCGIYYMGGEFLGKGALYCNSAQSIA